MLSVVVVAENEEKNIGRALASVQFADEIVVVDGFSEDGTADIAWQHGARVIERKWDGFATQKQFAIDAARGEWILLVDADEEATVELGEEILALLAANPEASGYRVHRRNQFLGRWIDHGPWTKDAPVRLFRKDKGEIARRPVHEGVQLDGFAGALRSPLNHYTHQTLSESIGRMNTYTTLEAEERRSRRRIGVIDILFLPVGVFLSYYVRNGGWRMGVHGFLLAATTAMYRAVLYVKIFLLQRQNNPRSA
jgi:glycosyltransferase involved in cell wall biosynthesis